MLTAAAAALYAQAPAWDSTGNNLLQGTYYFRQVYYLLGDNSGDLAGAYAIYGQIVFHGDGTYATQNATLLDYYQSGAATPYSISGTYSIAKQSGYGFLSGIYCPAAFTSGCGSNNIYVLVSNGIITGTSAESNLNDLFVGAQVPSPVPTTSTFQGSWTLAGYVPAFGSGEAAYASDVFFPVTPDGNGNLGTVNVTGYFGGNGGTQTIQSDAGMKYSFSNGAANIVFPNNNTSYFFAGPEYLYFSQDGSFCFGGSPQYPDMIIGVRAPTSGAPPALSGIYYTAGIDENESQVSAGFADFDAFYGSLNAFAGNIIGSDRVNDLFRDNTYSSTYYDSYKGITSGGLYSEAGFANFALNGNGSIRIGAGIGPYLSLTVAVAAPSVSGSGVFLNPLGISDAASAAPFTTGITGGEFVSLYGSGFTAGSAALASSLPLPTSLGNVKVLVDGIAAPIDYVSPGQINFLVPFAANTFPIATIQVISNNAQSNTVTEYVRPTTPGIFTGPPNGIGYGKILHQDGVTPVTESDPAAPGETVSLFASGLGPVFPPATDGAAGPSTSNTTYTIGAEVGGIYAPVSFSGLAPGFAGLYQVNVQIPSTTFSAEDQTIELDGCENQQQIVAAFCTGSAGNSGLESSSAEAVIPVGSSSTASSVSTPAVRSRAALAQRNAIHAAQAADRKLRTGLQIAR
jgi:uncharacterized protein (TIGR03437 family)